MRQEWCNGNYGIGVVCKKDVALQTTVSTYYPITTRVYNDADFFYGSTLHRQQRDGPDEYGRVNDVSFGQKRSGSITIQLLSHYMFENTQLCNDGGKEIQNPFTLTVVSNSHVFVREEYTYSA